MVKLGKDVCPLYFCAFVLIITVSRIALVKPQKADTISDLLLQMARSGQVRQRVTEDQLIMLLDQVDQATSQESTGKITVRIYFSSNFQVTRKKTLNDDDDDWDL